MTELPDYLEAALAELSPGERLLVAPVFLAHGETVAVLLSGEIAGKTLTGREIASALVRVAQRVRNDGGASS